MQASNSSNEAKFSTKSTMILHSIQLGKKKQSRLYYVLLRFETTGLKQGLQLHMTSEPQDWSTSLAATVEIMHKIVPLGEKKRHSVENCKQTRRGDEDIAPSIGAEESSGGSPPSLASARTFLLARQCSLDGAASRTGHTARWDLRHSDGRASKLNLHQKQRQKHPYPERGNRKRPIVRPNCACQKRGPHRFIPCAN